MEVTNHANGDDPPSNGKFPKDQLLATGVPSTWKFLKYHKNIRQKAQKAMVTKSFLAVSLEISYERSDHVRNLINIINHPLLKRRGAIGKMGDPW